MPPAFVEHIVAQGFAVPATVDLSTVTL
jgi:hypothetical protein